MVLTAMESTTAMGGFIQKSLQKDLGVLYFIMLIVSICCITIRFENVGYLLLVSSLIGYCGFHHKLNVLAMFAHVCLTSMAFEYAYLSRDIKEKNGRAPDGLFYFVLIYLPVHLVLVINRLICYYHYTRKRLRRLRRRNKQKEENGEKRKSRPLSIMQLKDEVESEEDEFLWKSWQDFFFKPKAKPKSEEEMVESSPQQTE